MKIITAFIAILAIVLNANFAFGQSPCTQSCAANAGNNQTLTCCCACVTLGNGMYTATCGGATIACSGCTYSWSPAAGLSATNIATPCANPTVTTTYTLTVTYPSNGTCCCFLATGDHCTGNVGTICPRTFKSTVTVVVNMCVQCCRMARPTQEHEELNTGKYVLYPNPSAGMFILSMDEHQSSVSMDVFDMQGKNVWSQDNISEKTVTINISNLPKGAYFIQVKEQDKVTYVKKIIVQ